MFKRSEGMKPVSEEWHRGRREAAEEAFSLDEFGDIDIVRFDLDEGYSGDLPVPTGKDNDRTYRWRRPLPPTDEVDVRSFDTR